MVRYVRDEELIADVLRTSRRSERNANRPTGTERARTMEVAAGAASTADQAATDVLAAAQKAADAERKASEAIASSADLVEGTVFGDEASFAEFWRKSDPDFGRIASAEIAGANVFVVGYDTDQDPPVLIAESGYIYNRGALAIAPGESVTVVLDIYTGAGVGNYSVHLAGHASSDDHDVASVTLPISNPVGGKQEVLTYTNETAVAVSVFFKIKITTTGSSYLMLRSATVKDATAVAHALKEAEAAKFLAEGIYQVIPSETEPTEAPNGAVLKQGDQWWKIGTGATAGKFVGVAVWNGAEWQDRQIVADSVLVPGSVGNILLEDGAIDGMTVTGALIRTAASGQRLQLDINGLRALNAAGVETARLFAGTGGLSVDGQLVAENNPVISRSSTRQTSISPGSLDVAMSDSSTYMLTSADPNSVQSGVYRDVGVHEQVEMWATDERALLRLATDWGGGGEKYLQLETSPSSPQRLQFSDVLEIGSSSSQVTRFRSSVEFQGDTDWIYPTLLSGSVAAPGAEFGYRRYHGVIWLTGRIVLANNAIMFVLPPGFRIEGGPDNVFTVDRGGAARFNIKDDGTMQMLTGGNTAAGVGFTGTSYLPAT